MQREKTDSDGKYYDVVISGMGPAGLATALEAVNAGKSVLIISNRPDEFIRGQKIGVDKDATWYLYSYKDEDNNPSSIETKLFGMMEVGAVSVKTIEKYLKSKLDNAIGEIAGIDYRFESQLSAIDLAEGRAMIASVKGGASHEEPIAFTFLIGADGVHRHAFNLLNETGQAPEMQHITHESHPDLPTQHVSYLFVLKQKNGEELRLPERSVWILDDSEHRFGISMDMSSYVKSGKRSVKCQLLTSYPDAFNALEEGTRAETIKEYMRDRIVTLLEKMNVTDVIIEPMPPSKKHGARKDKLQFGLFQTKRTEIHEAAVERSNHFFIAVGDAAYQPDYRLGEGLGRAFADAQYVRKILSNEMTIQSYNKKHCKASEESQAKTKKYINSRLA